VSVRPFVSTSPPEYCDRCVCLFVCLSVCSHNSKTTKPNVNKCLCCCLCSWFDRPPATALRLCYVLSVVWMTMSSFHTMGQWARIKHDFIFRRNSLTSGTSWTCQFVCYNYWRHISAVYGHSATLEFQKWFSISNL